MTTKNLPAKGTTTKKTRPVTITFTDKMAVKIRKQAKLLGMSSVDAARAFARLGLILCDTSDKGVELRNAMRSQGVFIDSIFDMEPEVISNLYTLPGHNGLP